MFLDIHASIVQFFKNNRYTGSHIHLSANLWKGVGNLVFPFNLSCKEIEQLQN